METLRAKLGIKKIDIFSNKEIAFSFSERCNKQHLVLLGDNNKFWVCCFYDAQKLVNNGYELA